MLTHVVMFKLRDRSPGHVAHCKQLLDGLPPITNVRRDALPTGALAVK